ncbi:MAG: 1-deoxy-D-xylulose-5-phosphate synthase N-terminal domain-containing protein [Candidatus Planktophila sp.]|jgi:transketolase|tara:strand:- start:5965 stop:6876 length:912 start_codon:yes stop_codon:yes gene_type:complete
MSENRVAITEIERIAKGIRRRVLEHSITNNGGYMSQACSSAELLASLYGEILNFAPVGQPIDPPSFIGVPEVGMHTYKTGQQFHGATGQQYDRLISSPAHYALVIYAALIETGRLRADGLEHFNRDGSTVEMIGAEHSPGFETTTGSLAQALSQAGGIALARKIRKEKGRTWVFMSDGEFQEGQTYEALQAAMFYGLANLRVIVDVNLNQCDGPMDTVMKIEPLADRIRAFGWNVSVLDGHDIPALLNAAKEETNNPHMLLCYTDPVRGLPILEERKPILHYLRFTGADERAKYEKAYQEMVK